MTENHTACSTTTIARPREPRCLLRMHFPHVTDVVGEFLMVTNRAIANAYVLVPRSWRITENRSSDALADFANNIVTGEERRSSRCEAPLDRPGSPDLRPARLAALTGLQQML